MPVDAEGNTDVEDGLGLDGGLSVGAQAGIGVAAGVLGIGLGVFAALMWMRRRKKQKAIDGLAESGKQLPENFNGFEYKTELAAHEGNPRPPPQQPNDPSPLSSASPPADYFETTKFSGMPNVIQRQELDSQRPLAELSSAHYGR